MAGHKKIFTYGILSGTILTLILSACACTKNISNPHFPPRPPGVLRLLFEPSNQIEQPIPSKHGFFRKPAAFAIDKEGNYYVLARENHNVQKFSKAGEPIIIIGQRGSGPDQFQFPESIALDSKGCLYVVDTGNACVKRWDPVSLEISAPLKQTIQGDGRFKKPEGIFIDSNDNIYISDTEMHCIQKFNTSGDFLKRIEGEIPPRMNETKFVVEEHGLKFPNAYDDSDKFDLLNYTFTGLCGGMCFAALDLFYANHSVPNCESLPYIKNNYPDFWVYLKDRQHDSIFEDAHRNEKTAIKIIEYTVMNDAPLADKTASEFKNLLNNLDHGMPTVLCLIKTNSLLKINKNHEVLAVGYVYYDQSPDKDATIYIYDPNTACKQGELKLSLKNPENGLNIRLYSGNKPDVRGFLVLNNYTRDLHFPRKGLGRMPD